MDMNEAILLERFILNSKATNLEHQEALGWLQSIVKRYEEKVAECEQCKKDN